MRYYAKNWLNLLGALFIGAIIGVGYTAIVQTPLYKSEGTLIVTGRTGPSDTTTNNYAELFKSRLVLESVVKDKHYDGTIFHRVIDGFMIQGGGMTANLQEKATRTPIPLEANNGLKNVRYSIAMARRPDPNSATAQFFINVKDNTMLDAPKPDGHGYAVFGQVIAGQEVVDKIRQVPTGRQGMYSDVPLRPVTIIAATQL